MANRAATIVMNAKLEGIGWRRGTLIKSKNGRIKPDAMMYNGIECPAPQGTYQIRHYVGAKAVYVTVGNDLDAALALLEKHKANGHNQLVITTLDGYVFCYQIAG